MVSRTVRVVALALPLMLACVLAVGGLRVHDGRVERLDHASVQSATPVLSTPTDAGAVGSDLRHQLSVSVPWPAFVGLLVLCLLPAVASLLAWSGARRGASTV